MKKTLMITTLAAAAALSTSSAHAARDYISIVGSSTVYPFSTVVAERFGKSTNFKTPKIEATGSGGGLKLFCQGVGVSNPDIANSSRRIKASEFELCQSNGVKEIIEVLMGYDGIVLGSSVNAERLSLTRKDLYLALAKQVPNPDGSESFVDNPYKTWKDVNPALPATAIEVMGPPPTSGTRDAFNEMVLEGGCGQFPWIKALEASDHSAFKAACLTMREDGPYIEAGENDNLIVQKLNANKNLLGIFGFSFLDQNTDKIQGTMIDGEEPTFESIADGSYPVSRPLYFYVKKEHIGTIPGITEFITEFTSNKAFGDDGYLVEKGMIPLSADERKRVATDVKALKSLQL